MNGRLIGIARHDRPKGPMESLAAAVIVPGEGIHGDFRGALKSGRNRREVTVMTHEDWTQAAVEANATHIDWFERRANLLVEGVMLPREPGATIHLSGGVVLEVTGETAPCERMEALAGGLRAALTPDWRGGVTTIVRNGGPIAVGDDVECRA